MTKLTLRVPDDIYEKLLARARAARRSINNQIVFELENADNHEREQQVEGDWETDHNGYPYQDGK